MSQTLRRRGRSQKAGEQQTPPPATPRQATPQLFLCGINHVRAPIALREFYALEREPCAQLIRRFKAQGNGDQILVLSTCNRTEIIGLSAQPRFAQALREAFLEIGERETPISPAPPLYEYEGIEAARHLFAVAAGLDSLILGENQIKQQLRAAHELSQAEGVCGAELHRLIEATFRASKRIRTETDLNVGTLCVGKAAVLKGEQVLEGLAGRECLLIGAGKIGRIAARAIQERGPAKLWIVNRTLDRAQALADEVGGTARGLGDLPELLARAEFILGAAYAPELILEAETYARARSENYSTGNAGDPPGSRARRVCMVDASVPRILDPALARLEGVELFDIETMNEIVGENRRRRTHAAQVAWQIVEEEVEKYRAALQAAELAPILRRLGDRFDAVFGEEQGALAARGGGTGEAATAQEATQRRLKQRLMHEVIMELKGLVGE